MKKLLIVILFLISINLSAQDFYLPNMLNMPFTKDKNEVKATLIYGLEGLGLHASYSIKKNLVLVADYSTHRAIWDVGSDLSPKQADIGCRFNYNILSWCSIGMIGGIGYGYANDIKDYPEGSGGSLDIGWLFGGFGGGGGGGAYREVYYELTGPYEKVFLQPSINLGDKKDHFNIGFGLRINQLINNDIKYSFTVKDKYTGQFFSKNEYKMDNGGVFADPGFTLEAGSKSIKFHCSVYWSYQRNQDYMTPGCAVGICANLSNIYKNQFTIKNS